MNTPRSPQNPASESGLASLPPPVLSPAPLYYGGQPAGSPYYGELPPDGEVHPGLGPLQVLRIAHRKWLTILLVASFVCGAAVFYLSKAPRIYRARAMIELSARRPRIQNTQEAVIEDSSASRQSDETLNTQIEKFKGKAMLSVVSACYRQKFPEDKITDEDLARRLKGGVDFELIRRTRLVQVTFQDRDPEFAIRACEAFIAGAEASARAENREASNAAVAWLEAQAQTQKKELEDADSTLFDARQKYQLDVLAGERKTVESALLGFNESLTQIENKVALEQKLMDALDAGHLPMDIPRAKELEIALERWRAAIAERDALLSRYTLKHPAVEAQQKAVALYRDQVKASLQQVKSTTQANLDLYRAQAESLRQKKEEQLKRASELEGAILIGEMKIAALDRTRSAADASYLGVLSRIQEARLSADENTTTVKLVEGASTPILVFPPQAQILFIALLVGLAGGFGLALLSVTLEDHLEGTRDIETAMGIKILAIIPHVKVRDRKEIAKASLTHRFKEVAESFAGLRSVLDSAVYREQTQIILVASSLPAEGKTTACCNLATACALNGQKTLLIDFDLRRPRVGGIFTMPPGHLGLLEYLASQDTQPHEIVYPSECRNLSIIASRPSGDARPAELVGGTKVANLLAWARANYDRILIDAPPLGIVSDALSLAGLSNCVLVMVRPATSRKRAVRHTLRRFQDVGVNAIAIVVNDVDHSKFSYNNYGPYYYYQKHFSSYSTSGPAVKSNGRESRTEDAEA
jgi:polysaccharide biosynthesis transport protein